MDSAFMVTLGLVVRNKRKELALTQADLGQKVDRPQSSIARLESGQLGDTHFGFVVDLANALNMKVEELVAKSFGRDFPVQPDHSTDKSEVLNNLKFQLLQMDPITHKMLASIFEQLSEWIKEVPGVPEYKK